MNAAYDTLRKEGRTASYIHNVNGALSLVMKSAVREGLIPYDRHADTGVDLGRGALPRRQLQGLRADAQEGEGVQDARRLAGRAVQRKVGALCGKLGIDPADLSLLGGDASMLT